MAAALRTTKTITPTARLPTTFSNSNNPLNLSFSSAFPSLNLTATTTKRPRGALVVRMASAAAGSYASALADIAISNNTLETTSSDVEKIDRIFSDKQVFDFFINPLISLEKKREVVDELAKSQSLQPHTVIFLNVLLDAKRTEIVKDIVEEFEDKYNKITQTELAVVTSVVPLDSQHLAQIAKQVQKLTGSKNVRIKTKIDKDLVAGFTVRYGNAGSKLIDMSVKKQLEEIASNIELGEIELAA